VKYVANNRKLLAQVQADLPILKTISTKAAYPESALLPEPTEDQPDATPGPTPPAPGSNPTAPAAAPTTAPATPQPRQ